MSETAGEAKPEAIRSGMGANSSDRGAEKFTGADFQWLKALLPVAVSDLAMAACRWLTEHLRLIVIILVTAATLPFCIFSISINAQRIAQLALTEGIIQRGFVDLGKIAKNDDRAITITKEISDAEKRRSSILGQIGYGMWSCRDDVHNDCLSAAPQMLPSPGPDWFHGNSSEHNNILLALASGIIGAVLAIASAAYTSGNTILLRNALCQILTGATVGLLALYVIKGLKGPPLLTIAETVDVNAPYGIALTCTMAGVFSDDFIKALGGLFKRLTDKLANPPENRVDGGAVTARGKDGAG